MIASPKHHKTIMDLKRPAMLNLYKRLQLQVSQEAPPTFGRITSFVEQGMAENKERRSMTIVKSILDVIRDLSIFYSEQRTLYSESGIHNNITNYYTVHIFMIN